MAVLSAQQEKFAICIVKGMSQADAYREAYPQSKNWLADSVNSKASSLARKAHIETRIEALRAPVARKLGYTLETAMNEALKALDGALEAKQYGAAVAAAQLRAKLQGLLIERKEIAVSKMDNMTPSDKDLILAAAKAELEKRKRIPPPSDVTDVEPKA